MNFQDISDFVELIKNPKKAEDLLKSIKAKQDALDASVKFVGTVSEIDVLKKNAQKLLETTKKQAADLVSKTETDLQKRQEVYNQMFEDLRKQTAGANEKLQEANVKLEQAKSVVSDIAIREKKIRETQEQLQGEAQRLAKLTTEYEEKLAKLKSVMV